MKQLIKTLDLMGIKSNGLVYDMDGKPPKDAYQHRILMVVRDLETNEKEVLIDDEPTITYYVEKNTDNRTINEINFPKMKLDYIEKDKVQKVTSLVNNNAMYKDMAIYLGRENEYRAWKQDKINPKAILNDSALYSADFKLEEYYIADFFTENPFEKTPVVFTKGFFDIEVDSENIPGFPDPTIANCPINAISLYLDEINTLIGLFLRDDTNLQIAELEKNKDKFIEKIKSKYKKDKDYKNLNVELSWYDKENEIYLINDFFSIIHEYNPDFIGAWNLTSFDIQYIINRIRVLKYDPNEIICHDDIPYQFFNLDIDKFHQDFAERNSTFTCSDYTIWLDQLLTFANLRKQETKRDSYSLDAIVYEELGEHKHEFSNPEANIKTAPRLCYEEFIEYNLHDTMLLDRLEKKNSDFEMLYTLACVTETSIHDANKMTIALRNLARRFYDDNGYIMSNNHNKNYLSGNTIYSKSEYRGAFVADPNLNDNVGIKLNGKKSNRIFDSVIDFDLESLYPNTTLAYNIHNVTQIGKIEIENDNSIKPDEFADDILSKDFVEMGKKYFNLSGYEEMGKMFEEEIINGNKAWTKTCKF